jgi:hypothetical protein
MTVGSFFVMAAVLLVCAAHWMDERFHQAEFKIEGHVGLRLAVAEGLFVAAVLLVLGASYALKGIVPM